MRKVAPVSNDGSKFDMDLCKRQLNEMLNQPRTVNVPTKQTNAFDHSLKEAFQKLGSNTFDDESITRK